MWLGMEEGSNDDTLKSKVLTEWKDPCLEKIERVLSSSSFFEREEVVKSSFSPRIFSIGMLMYFLNWSANFSPVLGDRLEELEEFVLR